MRSLKIIWNITNKCGYSCEVCATYSNRNELDIEGKTNALKSILSVGGQNIKEIDFSGGDPLYETDSIQIIHDAINILGKEKISVTTTGKGIDNAVKLGKDLSCLLYNCEVTIDALEQFSDYLRNDSSYVITNQNAIRGVDKNITNLTINIPILNPKMDEEDIRGLVTAISEINVMNISVNLIILMNVGRRSSCSSSNEYFLDYFVRIFSECARNVGIKNIHIHCALRGKILENQCNMLNDKIGIDCSGNVFACAWGAYINGYDKENISENPFYIGNLLEKTLSEILVDKRAAELEQAIRKKPTKHCRVFCYKENDDNSIFEDTDPIFNVSDV